MNYFKIVILALIINLITFAGNGAGGGTDSHQIVRAWFLGSEKMIQSCIKVSPQFGWTPGKLASEIKSVYQTWGTYLENKNVAWDMGSTPLMSSKINVSEECVGTEDLVFYFGIEDAQVTEAKKHYTNPYGFAEQVSYDYKTGTSKGFIWIAPSFSINTFGPNYEPDWNIPYALHGILLHEVGHTMGNGHVRGTVMDEDYANFLGNTGGHQTYALTHIDLIQELHVCRKCNTNYSAYSESGFLLGSNGYLTRAFEFLTGKKPNKRPTAKFEMKIGAGKLPEGQVTFKDDKGTYVFNLKTQSRIIEIPNSSSVFSAEYANLGYKSSVSGYSFFGSLEGLGTKRNIILNRNIHGHVEIVSAETGKLLFISILMNGGGTTR